MPQLLDKRLLIFTGKGGAGKSTVAAAAAVAAARLGKRVLIVEIGDHERISAIFGSPAAGYDGARVYTGRVPGSTPIWAMSVTAREALHEFAVRSMKFELLYGAVFENRVVRYFTAAAPGLDELTIMGKIEFMHREGRVSAKGPPFDLMIFDAPATGHGLALFRVPKTAMAMAGMGPLHSKAERMWKLLADPARTSVSIVSLPEEMSVSESIDLHRAAEELGLPLGKVVINGVYPDFFPGEAGDLRRLLEHSAPAPAPSRVETRVACAALERAVSSIERRDAQLEQIAVLAAALPREGVVLPFVFRPRIGPDEIEMLADELEGF